MSELKELRQYLADPRRVAHHIVTDTGELGDGSRNWLTWIDQGRKLLARTVLRHPDRPDLGDARRVREPASGLHVHHDDVGIDDQSGRQALSEGLLLGARTAAGPAGPQRSE